MKTTNVFLLLLLVLSIDLCICNAHIENIPLMFFHFNDAYQLMPLQRQPKAGAAYFKTLLDRHRNQYQNQNVHFKNYSLTVFSGDTFSPSLLSIEYNGQNMILPLNMLNIDTAMFGNHEFDYNLTHATRLFKMNNFKWLGGNMIDINKGQILAGGIQYQIFYRNGVKIGVFGVTQPQLLSILIPEYFDFVKIGSFVQHSQKMVKKLRDELKCELVVAVSHMTLVNDRKLAEEVLGIDIIFGGHDHLLVHEKIRQTVIIKSKADFKCLSKLKLFMKNKLFNNDQIIETNYNQKYQTQKFIAFSTILQVNHQKHKLEPDPQLNKYLTKISDDLNKKLQKTVLYLKQDVDLSFKTIRTSYSPYLSFVAEMYRHATKADAMVLNSGAFRAQTIMKAGPVKQKFYMDFMRDEIVVKMITGQQLYQVLENSLAKYPSHFGGYSQMSRINFVWDKSKNPYQRVIKQSIRINGEKLNYQKIYKVAFRGYIAQGGDNFIMLRNAKYVPQNYPVPMLTIMYQYINLNQQHLLRNFPYKNATTIKEVNGEKYAELDLSDFQKQRVVMIDSTNLSGEEL